MGGWVQILQSQERRLSLLFDLVRFEIEETPRVEHGCNLVVCQKLDAKGRQCHERSRCTGSYLQPITGTLNLAPTMMKRIHRFI